MIDINSEIWDSSRKTLSGNCSIVENDSYEVQIVNGTDGEYWETISVILSSDDINAGVTTSYSFENNLTRIKFNSPSSRCISWIASFQK